MARKKKRPTRRRKRSLSGPSPLLLRCAELKRALITFVCTSDHPELAKDRERHGIDFRAAPAKVDPWIHTYHLSSGETPLQLFIERRRDHLSVEERTMLSGWHDYRAQFYEILSRAPTHLELRGLEDRIVYRVESNQGSRALRKYPMRGFVLTAIVPLHDGWLISGPSAVLPADMRRDVLEQVVQRMQLAPAGFMRNPDHYAAAIERQGLVVESFIAEFGSDEVVVPGRDLNATIEQFWTAHYRRRGLEEEPVFPVFGDELTSAETVGIVCDPIEGMVFLAEYARFLASFESPESTIDIEVVDGYLHDPGTSPIVFRRAAARFPDTVDHVMRDVLGTPGFVWSADGESLLRRHRPGWKPVPTWISMCDEYAEIAQDLRWRRLGEAQPSSRSP